MFGMGRKTMSYLAIGGAVAGAAAMLLTTKKGKELSSNAISGLSSLTDKAISIMPWITNSGSKTKPSVIMERNENNNQLHRGESVSGVGTDVNMKRGDSAMNFNPLDPETGANIRRGDSMEELSKDAWKL